MQNYLQRTKIAIKLKRLFVMSVLVLVSATVILAVFNRYSAAQRDRAYPSSMFMTLSHLSEMDSDEYSVKNEEMNNSEEENAKNSGDAAKNELKCMNVRVLKQNGSVETMALEDYVTACVLGEMPLGFETQAIMAQCIAARTFTVRQCSGRSKHKNADVCTDSGCCQSFLLPQSNQISEENLDKLNDAVNATRGIIMTYEGEPIEAVYHASSGGYTLDSEDVWGGRVEYLRSVPSPEGEAELRSVVYGHRVGMSQHGANILAQRGLGFADILKYYYSGISLDFLSES